MTSSEPTSEEPAPIASVASMARELDDEVRLIRDTSVPPSRQSARTKRGVVAGSLAAAMLAIGDIVEPQRAEVGIEAAADDNGSDGLFDALDFGNLPPLN